MARNQSPSRTNPSTPPAGDNSQKNPRDWVTGGEPMTGAQKSYLHTLASETHTEVSDDLTKGQASEKINELKQIDPRTSK